MNAKVNDQKVKNSLQNLELAYKALNEALSLPIEHDRDRAGIIKSFEFTYEMSWKTLKRYLEFSGAGAEIKTPREVLKKAYSLKLIGEESEWLQMIEDRNNSSHTYDQEIADEIIGRVKRYLVLYDKLLMELKKGVS